jgi:hypothetical protein
VSPGIGDGSLLCCSHPVLDLGKGLLDRVEIRRVGRQVPEPGACGADHLPDGGRLVGTEIVHDDDVARLEHGHELLLDIGSEALAVDRPVEDARCSQPIAAQRAKEGQRAPMTMRSQAAQALALRPPASQRRHVGLDPGLVDEDQPPRIETGLPGSPALSSPRDVGAGLLKSEQRFF